MSLLYKLITNLVNRAFQYIAQQHTFNIYLIRFLRSLLPLGFTFNLIALPVSS